jgi:hypothetical protein
MKTRIEKVMYSAVPPVRAKVVYGSAPLNRLARWCGFDAMTIGRYIFAAAGEERLSEPLLNHELIHIAQQQELWWVGQWVLYAWQRVKLWRDYRYGGRALERPELSAWRNAYYAIPFEREAYDNQRDLSYLMSRNRNAWKKYT